MKLIILSCIILLMADPTLTVQSSAFKNDGKIPTQYSCEGKGINPPLTITGIPTATVSLALIVDDPDAPNGTFDHWVMWNIPPTGKIDENSAPGVQGKNGRSENKYTGPCPPSGIHHYYFKVYALDTKLSLPMSTDKKALMEAMIGHTLAKGELVGTYEKKKYSEK
jgi:Raf kinase inhibitor-like YbhB/YbcL family protein